MVGFATEDTASSQEPERTIVTETGCELTRRLWDECCKVVVVAVLVPGFFLTRIRRRALTNASAHTPCPRLGPVNWNAFWRAWRLSVSFASSTGKSSILLLLTTTAGEGCEVPVPCLAFTEQCLPVWGLLGWRKGPEERYGTRIGQPSLQPEETMVQIHHFLRLLWLSFLQSNGRSACGIALVPLSSIPHSLVRGVPQSSGVPRPPSVVALSHVHALLGGASRLWGWLCAERKQQVLVATVESWAWW